MSEASENKIIKQERKAKTKSKKITRKDPTALIKDFFHKGKKDIANKSQSKDLLNDHNSMSIEIGLRNNQIDKDLKNKTLEKLNAFTDIKKPNKKRNKEAD